MHLWCLFVLALAVSARGLSVGPVTLISGRQYISYALGPSENNSLIECNYEVGQGEQVASIEWAIVKDEQTAGTFVWTPDSEGIATGLLNGTVNLTRDDGDLELTSLTYSLSANYTCTVTVDSGKQANATEEVLIVDMTSRNTIATVSKKDCQISVYIQYPFTFPRPTSFTGLFSPELGDYFQRGRYRVTVNYNGSVQHTVDETFEVNEETPRDFIIKNVHGVTKANGTFITLLEMEDSLYFEDSCKELNVYENQSVSYNSHEKTCFGTLKEPLFEDLKATVVCADGYIPVGNISSVIEVCQSKEKLVYEYEWESDEELEDLMCEPFYPTLTTPSAAYSNTYSMMTIHLLAAVALILWRVF